MMDKRVVSIVPGTQELLKRAKLAAKTQPEDLCVAEPMASAPFYSGYGSSASETPQSGDTGASEASATAVRFVGPEAAPAVQDTPGLAHVLSSSTEEFSKYVCAARNAPGRAVCAAIDWVMKLGVLWGALLRCYFETNS